MTTSLVIDASLTFRFLMPGATHERLRPLFDQWETQGVTLVAPTLWAYEMTSIISKTVYFDQLTEAEGQSMLAMISALAIQLVPPDVTLTERAYAWTRQLKRVAAYDSFYLALAEHLSCEFWTADQKLSNAVGEPWIHLAS